MLNDHPAWRVAGWRVIFVLMSVLLSAPASAADLKLVTFLQDDLSEYMPGAILRLPAVPGAGPSDLTGPISYYEYDDCFAQLGVSKSASSVEADLVLDYGALTAEAGRQGIVVAGGISVWIGENEYQAGSITLSIVQPDDRGAVLYLLKRLAGLCR